MDIPSDESQTEQNFNSKLTNDEDENPTDQDNPFWVRVRVRVRVRIRKKRKLVRSKPSSNQLATSALEGSVRTRSTAKKIARTELTNDQVSVDSSVVIVGQSDNKEGDNSRYIALMVLSKRRFQRHVHC